MRTLMGMGALAVALVAALPAVVHASTPGTAINPTFNYAGMYLGTRVAGNIDALVLKPPNNPIRFSGAYSDADGNFSVPEEGGIEAPPLEIDLGLDSVQVTAELEMAGSGTGKYDESTGQMSLDVPLAMTIRISDIGPLSEMSEVPLGSGPLVCEFEPLSLSFSTADGWPHPGKAFEGKSDLTDGAIAAAWGTRPAVTAVEGSQEVCWLLAGFLKPVGGFWFAQSTTELNEMPAPYPEVPPCELGLRYWICEEPPPWEWPAGPAEGKVTSLGITPVQGQIRAGGTKVLRVRIKNTGTAPMKQTIQLRSNNRQVRISKSIQVRLPVGETVVREVKAKASRRATGRATIVASAAGFQATAALTVLPFTKRR